MDTTKSPKIIRLEIDENDINSGVEAIALVGSPAIEEDFYMFSKQELESYSDYPDSVKNNAKRGIELNEKVGNKCATQVGKVRAQQLANGEAVSVETIKRMYSYLSRASEYYDEGDTEACGTISYLLWGGKSALSWAESKLKQIEQLKMEVNVSSLPDYVNEVSMSEDIPVFDDIEEAIIYSMIIGCEGEIHTHQLEDGTTIYMPCATHEDAQAVSHIIDSLKNKPKYWDDLSDEELEAIYDKLMQVGETEAELLKQGWVRDTENFAMPSTPDKPSFEDVGKDRIYRYQYRVIPGKGAPIEPNSRKFCIDLVKADKLYRKEDIVQMTITNANPGFAQKGALIYDIFLYKGGSNCRHEWAAIPFKKADVINPVKDLFAEQKEKKIVAGPLMIPDKLIYRFDDTTDEDYYVYFNRETIEKIAHKYMIQKLQDKSNLEHSEYLQLEDVALVESWIIEDGEKDKAYSMTGKVFPKGTWFGLMKINNETVWNEWIKTGMVSGFSVEGYFTDFVINASKQKFYYRTTKGNTDIVIDHNTDVVFILQDGERVAVLPDGQHELTNGETLVVRDGKAVKGTFASKTI